MRSSTGCHFILAILFLLSGTGIHIPSGAKAGKILALFQFPGFSHYVMFDALHKELARRGHQITVVSHFPQKTPLANLTDISLKESEPMMAGGFTPQEMLAFNTRDLMHFLWGKSREICEKAMEHPNMKKVIQSQEQYDLILTEIFAFDCCYGIAWKLGAPVIAMTSLARMPWGQFRVGNPENPAYFPSVYTPYTNKMTFWQRFTNCMWLTYKLVGEKMVAYAAADAMNRKVIGPEVPPLDDLLSNTSLIFLNSHFSINGALPNVPAVVEVGGLHVSPKKEEIPSNIGKWLDGAEKGAVYVSFGSIARAEDMTLPQLQAMTEVLGSIEERVVWKCNGAKLVERLGLKELPKNILAEPWMPQAAILAHRNVRAFVSHGGLMGSQESVFWGKPMIAVPLFSDQEQNANNLEERGMAIKLYFDEITKESFGKALRALLHDPSYMQNAQRLSLLFRDRPRSVMDEAVYWCEYVMRHRGAPHLRSAAVHLRWWQLWLLDVAALVSTLIATIFFLIRLFLRRLLRPRSTPHKVKRS